MKKSYLNSEKNTALSLQPSKAIYLLLMVFFVCLFGNVANAVTKTGNNGDWNNPNTWSPVGVPGVNDNVKISGTVLINVDVNVQSVDITGTLNVNSGVVITVGSNATPGSFTVGGTYSMVNSGISTLIVYGNYINNGASDFWKSDVIITGNLSTPSTSKLQNNGNVIVGGNISGVFDIKGNGTGQIYAVNPNATVTITPKSIDDNVTPGVFPLGESDALMALVSQVIISWCSATTTWNVTNGVGSWSNGSPTSSKNLIFSGNFNSSTDTSDTVVEGCSCKVNSGAAVVFTSGKTLKISNEIKILGPTGSLTFENNASLVQINKPVTNNPNSGSIIYKRKTTSVLSSDYTYWSSPVANQQLINVSPSYASGMFYSYNDSATPEDWKQETSITVMLTGKGYIIRGAQTTIPPGFYDAAFTGVPNNGKIPIRIGPTGTSNLLGNPYPSSINADLFLAANSTLVEGTIYLWTHNTAIQLAGSITNGTAGTGAYAYTSDDYASYNTTGGVATGNFVNGVQQTSNKPTGKIAAAQSFFTTSKAAGTVTFNNSMRVSGNNTQFFKTKTSNKKTTTEIEKNRLWLNLTNTQGAFKQTLIGYVTDATNEFDSLYDGESFDGNEFVDFYSVNQDKNLVIQGRALPFDDTDEVPLGFKSTIDGDFTINIDQVDGSLTNQAVFIEDKLTNTVTNLKSGNYTFNTVAGTFNERFVLRYTNKTLGTTNFDTQAKQVLVSNKNKQIKINSFTETIDIVTIYDLLGRQIYQKNKVNNNEFLISDLVLGHQTLIVKTSLQNGNTVTDKIIY